MAVLAWLAGCVVYGAPAPDAGAVPADVVLVGLRRPGGEPVELHVRDGRLAGPAAADVPRVAAEGFVVPAFVDSHVHLAYRPAGREMCDGGVAAAVDLGAPRGAFPLRDGPLVRWSGPMITAPRGYPTTSWGSGGYGAEVATPEEARAAVARNAADGATILKLPFQGRPALPDDVAHAAMAEAHARGFPVFCHALGDADAARAAALGCDGLAHTPVEPLADATVAAWSGKVVVSTLAAFGGSAAAVENLRRLRAAGVAVLYGTDFGNTRRAGIDGDELALLQAAGLDGDAILEAGTRAPAARWGFEGLGTLDVGARASFLVVAEDPRLDPATLARPLAVWVDGRRRP